VNNRGGAASRAYAPAVADDLLANQLAVADETERLGSRSPADGWTAGQVCAHLILNNGLFVETARAVQRGESPSYDNEHAVADEATAALAGAAGSVTTIAEWLRQSARSYAETLAALPAEVLDTTIVTTIRHDGGRIVDAEPRRLGDLMVGELTFHAGMHLEQVRALTPS
jgi:hypothetical protein